MGEGDRGIKKLHNLFEVYKKRLQPPEQTVVVAFQDVVAEVLGIRIKKEQCRYSPHTRTLSLKVPGQIKTELLMNKQEILTHLAGRLGKENAPTTII